MEKKRRRRHQEGALPGQGTGGDLLLLQHSHVTIIGYKFHEGKEQGVGGSEDMTYEQRHKP